MDNPNVASSNEGGVTSVISGNDNRCHEPKGSKYVGLNAPDKKHTARDNIKRAILFRLINI